LTDLIRFIKCLLVDQRFSGPINLVAAKPATNAEFCSTMARTLNRPQLPPLPSPIVRLLFGEMADAALLASSNIISSRQQELTTELQHTTLEGALAAIYSSPRR
jgi:NAD dependent epimerase/dehydratase family enzyme